MLWLRECRTRFDARTRAAEKEKAARPKTGGLAHDSLLLLARDDEGRRGPGFPVRRIVVVAQRLEGRNLHHVSAVGHEHALGAIAVADGGDAIPREGEEPRAGAV